MTVMANIWGSGGLFEQGMKSKMDEQAANAALKNSMVGVDRLNSDRTYDLGLRRNEVDLGMLGVNRQNADTNAFDADTKRLIGFNQYGKAAPDTPLINSLNLRSVNPYMPNKPLGMNNGGMAMKPKMVKQPGYMHGGKIQGYKKSGKIGDVAKDDGTDKVDVKAREGEYFLNPETVAHIGGGDYSTGVRNLDAIVRQATGKEPGPVPVGKSGKQGFNLSGATVNPADMRPGYLDAEESRAARANMRAAPQPVRPTLYVDPVAGASTDPNMGVYRQNVEQAAAAQRAAAQAAPSAAQRVADAVGASSVARGTGQLTDAAASGAEMAKKLRGSAVGRFLGPLGAAIGANDTVQGLRNGNYRDAVLGAADAAASVAPFIPAMAAGVPAAMVYGAGRGGWELGRQASNLMSEDTRDAIGGTINNAVRSVGNLFGRDWGVNDDALLMDKAAAEKVRAEKVTGKMPPAVAPRKEDMPTVNAPSAPKEPSLRDMMMERYRSLNDGLKGADAMKTITSLNQMEGLQRDLAKLEEAAGTRDVALAKARQEQQKDTDTRLDKHFTMTQVDDKGKVTKAPDPELAAAFRQHMQEQGINIYSLPNAEQDRRAREFALRYRGLQNFNKIMSDAGGPVSDVIDAYQIDPNGVGLGAALKYKGVDLLDAAKAWMPFTDNSTNVLMKKQVGVDGYGRPRFEAVPASKQFAAPTGGYDAEGFSQAMRDAASLRNLQRQMDKQK